MTDRYEAPREKLLLKVRQRFIPGTMHHCPAVTIIVKIPGMSNTVLSLAEMKQNIR